MFYFELVQILVLILFLHQILFLLPVLFLLQIFLICTGSMLISDNFKPEQKPAWRRSTMSREASQVNLNTEIRELSEFF